MNYKNEKITYKKENGKLYEIIKKEIDISSLDNDILKIENRRDNEYNRLLELREVRDK